MTTCICDGNFDAHFLNTVVTPKELPYWIVDYASESGFTTSVKHFVANGMSIGLIIL